MSGEQISFEEAREISIEKWSIIWDNLSDMEAEFSVDCGFCIRHRKRNDCEACEAFDICKGKGSELGQARELIDGLMDAVLNIVGALRKLEV